MIYDCFTFYNEFDLLELRFRTLYEHVDQFVLVEADTTHSGNPKPFEYELNKARYSEFGDKITHVKLTMGNNDFHDAWDRENFQRNGIMEGLSKAGPDDIVLISDLDEIVNPAILQNIAPPNRPVGVQQLMFYYYFNNLNTNRPWWTGTAITTYRYLKRKSPQKVRTLCHKKYAPKLYFGGWHFSYLGDTKFIINKIKNFAHQEYNAPEYTDEAQIKKAIESGKDIFNREFGYAPVPIDADFPQYLTNNQDKYKEFLRPVPPAASTAREIADKNIKPGPDSRQKIKYAIKSRFC